MSQTGTHGTRATGKRRTTWDEIHAATIGAGGSMKETIRVWRVLASRGIEPEPAKDPALRGERGGRAVDPTRILFGDLRGIPVLVDGEAERLALRMRASRIASTVVPETPELSSLLVMLQVDGVKARERLVNGTLRYVVKRAKEHFGPVKLEFQDLIQEGVIGLIKAVERYDPDRGPFVVCVRWWVDREIGRAIKNRGRIIRSPASLLEALGRLRRCRSEFVVANSREPTLEELAGMLEVTERRVIDLLKIEQDASTVDVLPDTNRGGGSPLADILLKENIDRLTRAVAELPARTRSALTWRFGLEEEALTYEEVGARMGVTKEGARQIVLRALDALGKILEE